MGREKRLADNRAKETMDTRTKEAPKAADRALPTPAAAVPGPVVAKPGTSTGRAIVQIFLLYALPVALIILIGKLVLKL